VLRSPAFALAALILTAPAAALAQSAPTTERFEQGATAITLHLHPFLTEEEVTILRLVGESPDALALFVPAGSGPGFGAIALAPADGFLRDGMPVDSAAAVADLPDAAQARETALAECNSARSGGASCVVVLDIAPK
jgi:hypothetical protein